VIQEPREKHARKKGRKVGNHFDTYLISKNLVEFENILSKRCFEFSGTTKIFILLGIA